MTAPHPTAPFRLMTIFAHPDDETFGCAGVMLRTVRAGAAVAVVSATRGEAGEIADPQLATPERLGEVREQELRNACAVLGVTDVSFLDYRDGQLNQADPQEAIGRIVAKLRAFHPDIVITFNANGMYGHLDHMAIHHQTLAAVLAAADPAQYPAIPGTHRVRKVYYTSVPREGLLQMRDMLRTRGEDFVPGGNAATIPVEEMGDPASAITTVIELTDEEMQVKQRSMRAHATQMPADGPFATSNVEELRQIFGAERFILAPPPYTTGTYPIPEDRLEAGIVPS